jgi:hypothetical protein
MSAAVAIPTPTPAETAARLRIARHEAGHALAWLELLRWSDFEVRIDLPPAERALGLVRLVPEPSSAPRTPVELGGWVLRERLRCEGVTAYAGVAAAWPRASGFRVEMFSESESDRAGFVAFAREHGRRRAGLHWPAWVAACRFIDARWGAVEAVAAGLLERGTLSREDVRQLVARAPALRNERPPW